MERAQFLVLHRRIGGEIVGLAVQSVDGVMEHSVRTQELQSLRPFCRTFLEI
jgi:hypothetical protein